MLNTSSSHSAAIPPSPTTAHSGGATLSDLPELPKCHDLIPSSARTILGQLKGEMSKLSPALLEEVGTFFAAAMQKIEDSAKKLMSPLEATLDPARTKIERVGSDYLLSQVLKELKQPNVVKTELPLDKLTTQNLPAALRFAEQIDTGRRMLAELVHSHVQSHRQNLGSQLTIEPCALSLGKRLNPSVLHSQVPTEISEQLKILMAVQPILAGPQAASAVINFGQKSEAILDSLRYAVLNGSRAAASALVALDKSADTAKFLTQIIRILPPGAILKNCPNIVRALGIVDPKTFLEITSDLLDRPSEMLTLRKEVARHHLKESKDLSEAAIKSLSYVLAHCGDWSDLIILKQRNKLQASDGLKASIEILTGRIPLKERAMAYMYGLLGRTPNQKPD